MEQHAHTNRDTAINRYGVASLVLGALAVGFGILFLKLFYIGMAYLPPWIQLLYPFSFVLAVSLSLLGFILGIAGIRAARRGGKGMGLAVVGLVLSSCSLIAIVIAVLLGILVAFAFFSALE